MRSKLSVGLALAALGASMGGFAPVYADIQRSPHPRFSFRSRERTRKERPQPGSKVAHALGHQGVYHTGALNKNNLASAWARGWNQSRGTHEERIEQAHRAVEAWRLA